MFRKVLFGLVAAAGLTLMGTSPVDAGWRRAYRHGYYAAPYYGGYAPRRAYRRGYYAPVNNYGYGYNNYYGGYYGSPYYSTGMYYGPGIGVMTPGFGVYVR